jgi:hypothetical protein
VNEPQVNVDHFYHRPVYHVVGLLGESRRSRPSPQTSPRPGWMWQRWRFCAASRGPRILDEHGRYHGLRGRIVQAFQRLGYDETTLEIYDEALRDGDLLLQVPAPPAERRRIVALLQRHDVHDLGYFGPGTFAQFRAGPASTADQRQ